MAVDDCIRRGILADFLARHKAQVIKVSIYEITEEEYKEVLQRDAREDGVDEGELRKLITQIRKKIAKGKPLPVIAEELEETEENIVPLYKAVLAAGEDASEKEIVEQFLWK